MSDKKPTAVQWLVLHFNKQEWFTHKQKEYIKQALEMEKQQIIDAYKSDRYPCSDEDAEQYYTDTYKP